MQTLKAYLPYWPIIAASLLFLILGLWWRLTTARAMERAPKPLNWVEKYRAGDYALGRHLPRPAKPCWWLLLVALLAGGLFAAAHLANTGMIYQQKPELFFYSRYGLFYTVLRALGTAAVYWLLTLLFAHSWAALPGALLFAASAARGQGEGSLLALCLLLLVLYLRAEKPGFPAELLYLAAVLMLAPAVALRPGLIWLALGLLAAHWYKLGALRRSGKLSGGVTFWALAAALLAWALALTAAAVLRRWLMFGFQFRIILKLLEPKRVLLALRLLLRSYPDLLFARPTRGMLVDLMVDAPLFGLGLWGCCSAWVLARKRRDSRGGLVLLVLAALLLCWLLTGRYILTLGLVLTSACALRDAHLGKKRLGTVLLLAAAICWSVCIQLAAWYVPLTAGLVERLV